MSEELRTFDVDDQLLGPCDGSQVAAWVEFYETTPDVVIRETCETI